MAGVIPHKPVIQMSDIPHVEYKIKGLPLPDKLTSIGIVGFILRDGVEVQTIDNQLTLDQIRAIARFLMHDIDKQEIQEWAKDCFNPDEVLPKYVKEYVVEADVDPKLVVDPFGLIHLHRQY